MDSVDSGAKVDNKDKVDSVDSVDVDNVATVDRAPGAGAGAVAGHRGRLLCGAGGKPRLQRSSQGGTGESKSSRL